MDGRNKVLETLNPCVRIVEDDPSVQNYLARLLRKHGIEVIVYNSAEAFMSEEEDISSQPGCALVDLKLPGMGGAELIDWISQQPHCLPTIVITGSGTVQLVTSCFRKGVVDFIVKPMDPDVLLNRVRHSIERDVAERAQRGSRESASKLYAALSSREREVMLTMCRGLSSKQISYELGVSVRTVEHHRASVMAKLLADSLAHVFRIAVELRLQLPPIGSSQSIH